MNTDVIMWFIIRDTYLVIVDPGGRRFPTQRKFFMNLLRQKANKVEELEMKGFIPQLSVSACTSCRLSSLCSLLQTQASCSSLRAWPHSGFPAAWLSSGAAWGLCSCAAPKLTFSSHPVLPFPLPLAPGGTLWVRSLVTGGHLINYVPGIPLTRDWQSSVALLPVNITLMCRQAPICIYNGYYQGQAGILVKNAHFPYSHLPLFLNK